MISIKTPHEIELMRLAGRAAAAAREAAGAIVRPGVTTAEIDTEVRKALAEYGAKPSFLGYRGYPAAVCVSVNEEVIHGIPGGRTILEGDLVSIDVGSIQNGYQGDTAKTFFAGKPTEEAARLVEVTEQSFYEGIRQARAGNRVSDISHAVQKCAEKNGFSVVRVFTGHGIGTAMHEDPEVPNFGRPGRGPRLLAGMTLAIEPMLNAGTHDVVVLKDGWTVVTADGALSAHYEHTVLITDGEPEILTVLK